MQSPTLLRPDAGCSMYEELKIIHWPDPRLLKVSTAVKAFEPSLKALAERMFALMREHRGVGLAAPQVGQNIRMFVMNPTGKSEDDRVYVNPILTDAREEDEAEEGCLSLPEIHVNVLRSKTLRMTAQNLEGRKFEETQSGYIARIWQHETDHLDGILLTDKMGPLARLGNRKKLNDLKARFAELNKK